ncbi:methyl-accepting chemotaxis protein [Thalassotalea castellviae]|uniref:Methyl-accepting chemotaxis protein n=1 Tax=Thalassotalea castellviae TaxID=3075612 RepID=A0ABU3A4N6_9GAMM|nr:methyl-accepting chemotaxis protein [Thalassotalea sp. W431]MDT0605136.1 methyl-accepting chemotaxis protein [Thalassotalea sp. W431]
MLIKQKLALNTSILVVAIVFLLIILNYSSGSLQNDLDTARTIGAVESDVLNLRRDEKDFLSRKDLKYVASFKKNVAGLKSNLNHLEKNFESSSSNTNQIKSLLKVISDYEKTFLELVETQKEIGLTPTDGLYGSLRSAVHDAEEILGKSNYQLLSGMLQLRRNEKDFMLRLDEKYLTRWQGNADALINDIRGSNLDSSTQNSLLDSMNVYRSAFENLVAGQVKLGLTASEGQLGEMRNTIHQVDNYTTQLVAQTKQDVKDHISSIATISYSASFIILVLAISAAVWTSRDILNSINKLKDTMIDISNKKDLSIAISTEGNDELAEMAGVFNQMIGSFRNLIVQVNQSVDTVNIATRNLSENIHKANEGVDSQIQQTDLVATAVTEMVATVDEIASNTHEAANKAETTHQNAEKGKSGVESTITQIDQLSNTLLESENIVQELAKDSDTIGSVLDVIRGIAEQTNLLALNAAIEAARAGEQGRGFAVVADEVRTLASRTQDSTQEIESIIGSLQSRTKDIVSHMAACRTQGQESADQASSAGEMLEEITLDVSTIMEMNTAIATAIQEQSTVASEVNQHVVMIRDVAESSGESAIQNGQMSEELSQQADVLNNEVNQFKV